MKLYDLTGKTTPTTSIMKSDPGRLIQRKLHWDGTHLSHFQMILRNQYHQNSKELSFLRMLFQ